MLPYLDDNDDEQKCIIKFRITSVEEYFVKKSDHYTLSAFKIISLITLFILYAYNETW